MSCHPAYMALSYDELLMGEEVSDTEFRHRYQAEGIRAENRKVANIRTEARSTSPSPFALARLGRAISAAEDGAKESGNDLRFGS
jgi:hypothetical protein